MAFWICDPRGVREREGERTESRGLGRWEFGDQEKKEVTEELPE